MICWLRRRLAGWAKDGHRFLQPRPAKEPPGNPQLTEAELNSKVTGDHWSFPPRALLPREIDEKRLLFIALTTDEEQKDRERLK